MENKKQAELALARDALNVQVALQDVLDDLLQKEDEWKEMRQQLLDFNAKMRNADGGIYSKPVGGFSNIAGLVEAIKSTASLCVQLKKENGVDRLGVAIAAKRLLEMAGTELGTIASGDREGDSSIRGLCKKHGPLLQRLARNPHRDISK